MDPLANILETLSNIQNDNFQILHKIDTYASTQPQNLNVLSTMLRGSRYSGSIAEWFYAATSGSNAIIPISSNDMALSSSNTDFLNYVPFILDHQYRIIHEQQLQVSALARILADQQKLLPQLKSLIQEHDTILAKHGFQIAALGTSNKT